MLWVEALTLGAGVFIGWNLRLVVEDQEDTELFTGLAERLMEIAK